MRVKTEEEIKEFIESNWDWNEAWEHELKVVVSDDNYSMEFSAMYESPKLNFPLLMKLADFLGTKNINDGDRFANGGCETCDYGSSYGFTLIARKEGENK